MSTAEEDLVQVSFVADPKVPKALRVAEEPLAVPGNLKRKGLSLLLNHMLHGEDSDDDDSDDDSENEDQSSSSSGSKHKQQSFDFAINEQLLRTTLKSFMAKRSLSKERTLDITYFIKQRAPEPKTAQPHDDWVSCVAGNWQGLFLTGSYDHQLRLVVAGGEDGAQEASIVQVAHDKPIQAVCWGAQQSETQLRAFSASDDALIKSWSMDTEMHSAQLQVTYQGHQGSVQALAYHFEHQKLVSGSWDKTLCIWDGRVARPGFDDDDDDEDEDEDEDETEEVSAKVGRKRKASSNSSKGKRKAKRGKVDKSPLRILESHRNCVSCVLWPTRSQIISGSWDHSVIVWDVESGSPGNVLKSSCVVRSIAYAETRHLIVSAHSDNAIRLWDERQGEKAVNQVINKAHGGWVNDVSFEKVAVGSKKGTRTSQQNEMVFASASHDSTVRLWDVRSLKTPLHTIKSADREAKMLAVDLWSDWLAIGGTDNELRLMSRST